jgi:trehalose-6-phosphatase
MTIPALPVPTDLAARLIGTPFLLLLDVDGTITPIAATPAAAVVSEEARAAFTSPSSPAARSKTRAGSSA